MLSSWNDTAIVLLQQLKLPPLDLHKTEHRISQSRIREGLNVEHWLWVGRTTIATGVSSSGSNRQYQTHDHADNTVYLGGS